MLVAVKKIQGEDGIQQTAVKGDTGRPVEVL